jgi:hypothetical protein
MDQAQYAFQTMETGIGVDGYWRKIKVRKLDENTRMPISNTMHLREKPASDTMAKQYAQDQENWRLKKVVVRLAVNINIT